MKVYAAVRRGIKEEACDDRVLVGNVILEQGYQEFELPDEGVLLAVADGVGGNAGGWKAATMALEGIRITDDKKLELADMQERIAQVSEQIYTLGQESVELHMMASTLSVLYLKEQEAEYYHLGDTRIYQMRDSHGMELFQQHTEDQNLLNHWRRTKDESLKSYKSLDQLKLYHPEWASIVNWMGMPAEDVRKQLQIGSEIRKEGIFVLTSDGIHDYVEPDEFVDILESDNTAFEKIEELMQRARENGSKDDQSIIIAQLTSEE